MGRLTLLFFCFKISPFDLEFIPGFFPCALVWVWRFECVCVCVASVSCSRRCCVTLLKWQVEVSPGRQVCSATMMLPLTSALMCIRSVGIYIYIHLHVYSPIGAIVPGRTGPGKWIKFQMFLNLLFRFPVDSSNCYNKFSSATHATHSFVHSFHFAHRLWGGAHA